MTKISISDPWCKIVWATWMKTKKAKEKKTKSAKVKSKTSMKWIKRMKSSWMEAMIKIWLIKTFRRIRKLMEEIAMKTRITTIKLMMINRVIKVHKKNLHLQFRKMKMEVTILGRLKIQIFLLSFQIHHKVLIFLSTKTSSIDMTLQTSLNLCLIVKNVKFLALS